jgi:glycosyltransferase involved in cell wall biosynthesis
MITLLCSAYNSSTHIDQYLEHVNNQTLREFEIIFVDANSSDDTLQKIKDYQFRVGITKKVFGADQRIGIYEAWNRAIEHSSHDYVMNYNTDDKLFPSALQTMATYASIYPEVDVLYSNSFISRAMLTQKEQAPHKVRNAIKSMLGRTTLYGVHTHESYLF